MSWCFQVIRVLSNSQFGAGIGNFFCKGPESGHLCRPCGPCHSYSALLLQCESSHGWYIHKWAWLGWATGLHFANPWFRVFISVTSACIRFQILDRSEMYVNDRRVSETDEWIVPLDKGNSLSIQSLSTSKRGGKMGTILCLIYHLSFDTWLGQICSCTFHTDKVSFSLHFSEVLEVLKFLLEISNFPFRKPKVPLISNSFKWRICTLVGKSDFSQ